MKSAAADARPRNDRAGLYDTASNESASADDSDDYENDSDFDLGGGDSDVA